VGKKHSFVLNMNKKEKYDLNLDVASLFPIVSNPLLGDKPFSLIPIE